MQKVLIICGPTATGKSSFGIEMAKQLNGEIVSADSRQVYVGRDLITGKDLPHNSQPTTSNLIWKDHTLKYYLVNGTPTWLYDVVDPGEDFNVSFWKECADIVISDIVSRGKLPIIVGGTGLYIKSVTQPFNNIAIQPDEKLRNKLSSFSSVHLFDYLKSIDPTRAASLNESDAKNPRRLIRYIEISKAFKNKVPPLEARGGLRGCYDYFSICLTAPTAYLFPRIDKRVEDRIAAGAALEDPVLASDPQKWKYHEHDLARRQITWFKKQPDLLSFDISTPDWQENAISLVTTWYNK